MWKYCRRRIPQSILVVVAGLLAGLAPETATAQTKSKSYDTYTVSGDFPWRELSKNADAWFESDEAKAIAANILIFQSEAGIWPKKYSTGSKKRADAPAKLFGTYDNGATIGEMRFLARMVKVAKDEKCRQAFAKGLACIFKSQYASGGWPQDYPPFSRKTKSFYSSFITFNDNAMVNVLWFVRDVSRSKGFDLVRKQDRIAAAKSFERGIDCILKLQIKVKDAKTGKETLTAWCAQYDDETLKPREARKFEPAGIWGFESFWILRLLMSIEHPSPEVIQSVNAGCQWLERAKITNIAYNRTAGTAKKVEGSKTLWARINEIGTNRPLFADWDGITRYDMMELGQQRRTHYRWYHPQGTEVLAEWAVWKKERGHQ